MVEKERYSDEPYWLGVVRQIIRKRKHGETPIKEPKIKPNVKSTIDNKDTKFCYECGKKIKRDATFCEYCRAKQPVL